MPLERLRRLKFVRKLITTPAQRATEDSRKVLATARKRKRASTERMRHGKLGAHAGRRGIDVLRKFRGAEGHRMLESEKKKAL